jgi:hypothetical protein
MSDRRPREGEEEERQKYQVPQWRIGLGLLQWERKEAERKKERRGSGRRREPKAEAHLATINNNTHSFIHSFIYVYIHSS